MPRSKEERRKPAPTNVYVLVETANYGFRAAFGNMDALLAFVDDERERDPNGHQFNLTQYLDLYFTVVTSEVLGGLDTPG